MQMRTQLLIAVSLAISMLLIGMPARQHSHAAGDRPHSHGNARNVHSHDGHAHQHEHGHDHDGLAPSVAHVHVTLFGVDFTLPAESDDGETEEGQSTFLGSAPTAIELGQALQFAFLSQPILNNGEPLQIAPTFCCCMASAASARCCAP